MRPRHRSRASRRNGPASRWRCLAVLVLLLAWTACSRDQPPVLEPVYDLVDEFEWAILETRAVDFGSPGARAHLNSGWSPVRSDARGAEPFVRSTAWSSRLSFHADRREDIQATLDLRVARSLAPEGVELAVALNGEPLKKIELKAKRREYRLRLPAARLARGTNHLEFGYRHLEAGRQDRPIVQWFRLDLARSGGAATPPSASPESAVLFLPYGTEITYLVRLPARSVLRAEHLRFTGGTGGRFEVLLTSDDEGETRLASVRGSDDRPEVLLTPAGERFARLHLRAVADEGGGGGEAGVALRAPRVWGQAAPEPRAATVARPSRPNIFVYMIDTLRADHLGCYGYDRPVSPRIDRFAAGATLFEHAVGQSSWTRASVASLFTGLWPGAHGTIGRRDRLPQEAVTLAETLKENGYATAAVITNFNVHRSFGFDQGFDEYIQTAELKAGSEVVNAHAFSWLERRDATKPFFLYLHTVDPHNPYLPPERFRQRFAPDTDELVREIEQSRKTETWEASASTIRGLTDLYDALIAFNDESFGALEDHLRKVGLWDDAIVILVSDHGEEFYDHGRWSHGKDLHVETLNVPLIVKMPGQTRGRRRSEVVQHQDLLPTLLDHLGVDVSAVVQGTSFLSLLGDGRGAPRPDAYSHLQLDGPLHLSLVTSEWKLIRSYGSSGGLRDLLYRWPEDPREETDLAAARPVTAEVLAAMLERKRRHPGVRLEGGEADLSPELERQLRALGYLQ